MAQGWRQAGEDGTPGTSVRQAARKKWLRMVRLWEKEGTWAVLRGILIKVYGALKRIPVLGLLLARSERLVPRRQGIQAASGRTVLPVPVPPSHARWLAAREPSREELARQREASQAFEYQPLVSILCPVYNPPHYALREAIESVMAQSYENWQLCLVDGGSGMPEVQAVLREFIDRDPRIQIVRLEKNLGISGNSNAALKVARGDYVALFDHDDVLAPNMLYEVVACLNAHPGAHVVYFDEDQLYPDGSISEWVFFKPDWWSPEMLLSANYLMHSVIRRSLVAEVGGFDPDFDGTQDWDLLFRCTEQTERIFHVPKVLYHWRSHRFSASKGRSVPERQARCVEAHLSRIGIVEPKASFPKPGFLRVAWPTQQKKVSIIIPTRDKVRYLRTCLDSIMHGTAYPSFEVILVDTGSERRETRHYYESLRRDPRISLVDYRGPFNYSLVNNLGASHATGEIFLFLNNDVKALEADWLEEMARWAERPEIGAVGAKLLYPDGTIQHAGVIMGMQGLCSHVFWDLPEGYCGVFGCIDWYRNYMAVTGACMMMRREVFEAV
ncbi:MAG TPA: glycosyltransferase, partial [Chthonomonadaceae bacterium]|nr:glycosyltransferase [Chthonomonadaceae bacterium]